jgi:serine/threonine protein kinase
MLARKKRTGSPPLSSIPSGRAIVEELLASHPRGAPFDGPSFVAEHPELKKHRSAMLQLAYEDFCRRDELGMAESPTAFAARYPTISRSLLMQLGAHRLVVELHATADAEWPVTGQTWLGYHLLEELGRGAFSRVYLALEPALGNRPVVVKATSLGPHEACTLGMLRHPHIVPVHTVRWDDHLKKAAVCMAFVSRVTLFDAMDAIFSASRPPRRADEILSIVKELNSASDISPEPSTAKPWPHHWKFCDAVLQMGCDVAQALRHAHHEGVLHGDVKPSNILVTDSGSAVLLDFNLAVYEEEPSPFLTGTLPYMAPEQLRPVVARGPSPDTALDERTDIFGLGVTLFELAYGRYPFGNLPEDRRRQRTAAQLLKRQKRGVALPQGETTHIDRRVGEIILRCMEYDPAARPQSMDELLALLQRELKSVPRARRWMRSHRKLTAAAVAVVCAGGLAIGGWQATRDPYPIRELKKGEAAWQAGNPDGAVQHLTAALKTDPKMLEARFLRGCARCRDGEYLAASEDLTPLVEKLPDGRAAAALAHVVSHMDMGNLRAAVLYRTAINQGYRTAVIYNNLAYCRADHGAVEEAAEALKIASALDPNLSSVRLMQVRAAAQITFRRRRITDMPIVEEIVQSASSAELKLEAALYFFFCARVSSDASFRQRAIDRMYELLAQSLEQGLPKAQLQRFVMVEPNLKDQPRWQAIEAFPESNLPFKPELLVHDPLDELTRSQSALLSASVSSP